jgi:aminoglycoside 6'-N-acetyltransferase I
MVPLSDVGEHHGREYRGVRAEHLDECARLLVSTFNAEPWNQRWTLETAQKKLAWTLGVPGFMGLISLAEGVVAFAAGYRQHEDRGEVFYLSILCVGPEAQGTGVGIRFTGHLEEQLANGRYHGGCQARHSVGPLGWTSRAMPRDVSHPPLTPTDSSLPSNVPARLGDAFLRGTPGAESGHEGTVLPAQYEFVGVGFV